MYRGRYWLVLLLVMLPLGLGTSHFPSTLPIADFTAQTTTTRYEALFIGDSSSASTGRTITTFCWDFLETSSCMASNMRTTFTFPPNPSQSYDVGLKVTDSVGEISTEATLQVNIDDSGTMTFGTVNHAPVAQPDEVSVTEDDIEVDLTADLLMNDEDVDADTLSITTFGNLGTSGTISVSDGVLLYTPAQIFHGLQVGEEVLDTFLYEISDGNGGTAQAFVRVTITGVNDAPVAVDDGPINVGEDATLTLAISTVLSNDYDPDGDTVSITGIPTTENGGTVMIAGTSFVYTPSDNAQTLRQSQRGWDNILYTITDGTDQEATAKVSLTIIGSNDAPEAEARNKDITEDTPTSINIVATDVDTALTFRDFEIDTGPNHGTLNPISLGTDCTDYRNCRAVARVTYIPNTNYFGTDSFTFKAKNGALYGPTATVTINVIDDPDPPIANDDPYTILEDTTLVADGSGAPNVITNDVDVDSDLTLGTIAIEAPATSGIASVNPQGYVTYTPTDHFHGEDTFTYTVTTDGQTSNPATVTITVDSVNDAPTTTGGSLTTTENVPYDFVGSEFNYNDNDGDDITIIFYSVPEHGRLELNGEEKLADEDFDASDMDKLQYIPDPGFSGTDQFTFIVYDGEAYSIETPPATFTITVTPDLSVTNPQAWWKFDEATGIEAIDSSVAALYPGKLENVNRETTNCMRAPCVIFDGSTSRMPTKDVGLKRPGLMTDQSATTAGVTMIALVYPTLTKGGHSQVISTDNGEYDWGIYNANTGGIGYWGIFNGLGQADTGARVKLNQWQYIAATFGPTETAGVTTSDVKFYYGDVEGFEEYYNDPSIGYSNSDTGAAQDNAPVVLGKNPRHNGEYYQGLMDDTLIYSFVLTEDEIEGLFDTFNFPPLLDIPPQTFVEGEPFTPIDNINDYVTDDGTYTLSELTSTNFDIAISTDGHVTITPKDENWFGEETITFTVSDELFTVTDEVIFTVTNTNDAPTSQHNSITTNQDVSYTFTQTEGAEEFVFNDADDGDVMESITLETEPANGILLLDSNPVSISELISTLSWPDLSYVPNPGFFGADTFTFTVSDGESDSVVYTMSITVNPANQPPVAVITSAEFDGNNLNVDGSDSTDDVGVVEYQWLIDGDESLGSADPTGMIDSFEFKIGKEYTLTLRVLDVEGLDGSDTKKIIRPCTENSQCSTGKVCNVGTGECGSSTSDTCTLDVDCGPDEICQENICVSTSSLPIPRFTHTFSNLNGEINLDGSTSTDPENNIRDYFWYSYVDNREDSIQIGQGETSTLTIEEDTTHLELQLIDETNLIGRLKKEFTAPQCLTNAECSGQQAIPMQGCTTPGDVCIVGECKRGVPLPIITAPYEFSLTANTAYAFTATGTGDGTMTMGISQSTNGVVTTTELVNVAGNIVKEYTYTPNKGFSGSDSLKITLNGVVEHDIAITVNIQCVEDNECSNVCVNGGCQADNQPPVARFTYDYIDLEGDMTLDGSLSSDPDFNIEIYEWYVLPPNGGEKTTIGNEEIAQVTVPFDNAEMLGLQVTDTLGLTHSLEVPISAPDCFGGQEATTESCLNYQCVADEILHADFTIQNDFENTQIILDGTISGPTPLTYEWTINGVVDSDTSARRPLTIIANTGYTITLTVTDTGGATDSVTKSWDAQCVADDDCTDKICQDFICVDPPNQPPVAVIDTLEYDPENLMMIFDGSSSYDLDDDDITYEWFDGSTLLSIQEDGEENFHLDAGQLKTIKLVVSDGVDTGFAQGTIQGPQCYEDNDCSGDNLCFDYECVPNRIRVAYTLPFQFTVSVPDAGNFQTREWEVLKLEKEIWKITSDKLFHKVEAPSPGIYEIRLKEGDRWYRKTINIRPSGCIEGYYCPSRVDLPAGALAGWTFDEVSSTIVDQTGNGHDLQVEGDFIENDGINLGSLLLRNGRAFSDAINFPISITQRVRVRNLPSRDNLQSEATFYSKVPPRLTQLANRYLQPFVGRPIARDVCIGEFSFGTWVYPSDDTTGLIASSEGKFQIIVDGTVQWNVGSGSFVDTGVFLPVEDWTHLGMVFKDGNVTFYFDGEPQESADSSCDEAGDGHVVLGEGWGSKIDDTWLYSEEKFDYEMRQLVDRGLGREPLDYVSRWEFDESEATGTAADEALRHDGVYIGEHLVIDVLNDDSFKEEGYLVVSGIKGEYVQVGEVQEVSNDDTTGAFGIASGLVSVAESIFS